MRIYDITNKELSLYHDCLFRLGINRSDTTQYPLIDFIRNANNAYRKVNSVIWNTTGEWEYDDRNYNDLPIATTDLITTPIAQRDYELPSYCQKIDRVEIKDANGNWSKLIPMDKSEIEIAMTEFEETPGLPKYYDMIGRSILLYPTPATNSVTSTNGLKAYFSRDVSEFVITDTIKEPGFVKDFHPLISIESAIAYASIYDQEKVVSLTNQANELYGLVEKFYGSRNREYKCNIKPKKRVWR